MGQQSIGTMFTDIQSCLDDLHMLGVDIIFVSAGSFSYKLMGEGIGADNHELNFLALGDVRKYLRGLIEMYANAAYKVVTNGN